MDYAKIYDAFINNRRTVETSLKASGEYSERHHVVPIACGGGNEAANLISLTARDHYFAHCCLAKIHGGRMWSALFALANMTKVDSSASYFLKGRMVAVARRQAAQVRSENMTELWAAGLFKRQRVYGPLSDAHRARLSEANKGCIQVPEVRARQAATKRAAAKEFVFRHSETGQVFRGTQREFCAVSGVTQSLASCLTRGKIVSARLWVLEGTPVERMFGRDATVRRFVRADGLDFVGPTYAFRTKYGLDPGVISNLIHGKNRVKSFKGWRYEGEAKA
jgi:hypothetical protein